MKTKTTKTTILSLAAAFLVAAAADLSAQSLFKQWPELDAFHTVMSQTFHPMQDGDFQPIRERAGELHEKATALAKSTIPLDVNQKEIAAAVKKLQQGSKALAGLVRKKAPDVKIEKSLTDLHDVFHTIVGLCSDDYDDNH